MTSPIFFDSTGHRRRLVGRISWGILALILLAAAAFAATVVEVPAAAPLDFIHERSQALPFITRVAHLRHRLPPVRDAAGRGGAPQRMGFYVPWDPESAASLRRHFNDLDQVVAADASINLQSGKLVQLLTPYNSPDADIYAIYAERHRTSVRVKALIDFVAAAFRRPEVGAPSSRAV